MKIEKLLSKMLDNEKIVKKIPKLLIDNCCPSEFGLKDYSTKGKDCWISSCVECWKNNLK